MSGGRLARPNRVTPARARGEIDALAAAGDIAGLRRLGHSLPPLLAFTYERRRAAALALALEGNLDAALSEHALGRAALGIAPGTVAADETLLRRLAHGEPAAAAPRFDLRPLYGVAAVAATIALTVGVTLQLVAVDASLPAIEAPPEHADTFVRAGRPALARPDDRAPTRPARTGTPSASPVSFTTRTLPQGDGPRTQPRSRPARSAPEPVARPPRPKAPPPSAPPVPAPPPTSAPTPAEPAADTSPSQRAAPPPPSPEPTRKPGRRRGQQKQDKPGKKPTAPATPPPAASEQQPAPPAQPQPAAAEGHGPPEHANNDKDKEPKDRPEKEKG